MTTILRKTCSSLVKIISDGENNFKYKYNKYNTISTISCKKYMLKISAFLQRNKWKSANMWSSTVQLHGVDLIDIQIQNWL